MEKSARFKSIFQRAAAAQSRFAFSAAYAVAGALPTVLTSGPTAKGGAFAVANDARWHIGSVSKTFTSALVMRLVERGLLDLDQHISTYLTAFYADMHDDWKALTLRQLLSHTSGLPANAPKRVTLETYSDPPELGRLNVLKSMWSLPKTTQSGTFTYSNIGYVLAGFITEIVMGSSWEELIFSKIAQPLGLNSLGFGAPQQSDAPTGHRSIVGFKSPVSRSSPFADNPKWMGPAGTIHLTMSDLVKWGQAHLLAKEGKLPEFLSQDSAQTMQTAVSKNYGLGWVIQSPRNAPLTVWHNGSNTMWYAVLLLIPDKEIVVSLATNVFAPRRMDAMLNNLSAALWKY